MSKLDKIKEELSVLKEEYKNLFLFLLTTLTGTVTSFYQVMTQKVEFYILIISALGFVVSVFIMLLLKRVREKMDKDTKELGDFIMMTIVTLIGSILIAGLIMYAAKSKVSEN